MLFRHGGSPPRCRRSQPVAATDARPTVRIPVAAASASSSGAVTRSRRIAFWLDGPVSGDRDPLAPALEHEPVGIGADRGRLAGVHDAVDLTDVGQRRRAAIDDLEQVELGGDRDREHASARQLANRAAQKRSAAPAARRAAGSSASARCTARTAAPARTRGRRPRPPSHPGRRPGARARRSARGRCRARSRGARGGPGRAPPGRCPRRRRAPGRRARRPASATAAGPRRRLRTRGRARSTLTGRRSQNGAT